MTTKCFYNKFQAEGQDSKKQQQQQKFRTHAKTPNALNATSPLRKTLDSEKIKVQAHRNLDYKNNCNLSS